jgi:hypothetical protein
VALPEGLGVESFPSPEAGHLLLVRKIIKIDKHR